MGHCLFQTKVEEGHMGKCCNLQESRIAKEARVLSTKPSNITTAAKIEEDVKEMPSCENS